MARDLKDSIDILNATISRWSNLPPGSFLTPVKRETRRLEAKESGPSFRRRAGMVSLQSRIESDYNLIKESDKLFKAQAYMLTHPGAFRSAARKVRFDEIMSERRSRDRKLVFNADKSLRMRLLSINNSDDFERASLEEQFKYATGGGRFAADSIINAERRKKASDIHKERRSRDRKRAIAADQTFKRLMMDDYEGSIYDLMKGGLSRDQADQVYVKQNAKWLSVLAKNNPKIAKHIPAIAKTLGKVSKVPGLGIAAANPIAAAALLAGFGLSRMNESRKTVAGWESAESFLGHPSAELTLAMKQAGVGDEGAVIKQYGKMTSWLAELGTNREAWKVMSDVMLASRGKVDMTGIHEHSTPEDIAKLIMPQMQGLDFNEKLRTLNALSKIGINESVLKGFEIYLNPTKATYSQKWTGYKQNKIDSAKRFIANHPVGAWFTDAPWYDIPFIGDILTGKDMMFDWIGDILSSPSKAEDAARSADKYDAGGFSQGNDVGETNTTSNKVSFHIGEVKVDANDAQAFVDSLMREGGKFTERIRITDSFDSMLYA